MANNFPTKGFGLSQGESPSLYKNVPEDAVSKAPTDGGYEFRRRKFTRKPRRIIETGFIGLPHDDKVVLDQFYEEHMMDRAFQWFDYQHGVTRTVRFDDYTPDSVSVGTTRLWTVKIKMSEI